MDSKEANRLKVSRWRARRRVQRDMGYEGEAGGVGRPDELHPDWGPLLATAWGIGGVAPDAERCAPGSDHVRSATTA